MGYYGGFNSIQEIKNEVLTSDFRVLDSATVGRNIWVAFEKPDGERFICLFLCNVFDGKWAYKPISEDMGPCEVNCPQRLLDLVPVPSPGWAAQWRARVQLAQLLN